MFFLPANGAKHKQMCGIGIVALNLDKFFEKSLNSASNKRTIGRCRPPQMVKKGVGW